MNFGFCLKYIPEEIRSLFFIKIFTTYSYAVLYSSLVIYMTKDLGVSSLYAMGIVGVFISLNFLLHFLGGFSGGKFVSNRMLLAFGMVMELIGVVMIFKSLLIGLGIFLTGSGLYATSINAIMIQRYKQEDSRREVASYWIYSGMNLGFFIGHFVSGYFHIQSNYNNIFISSLLASFAALVIIYLNWHNLSDKTTEFENIPTASQRFRVISSISIVPLLILSVITALYYHSDSSKIIMLIGVLIFCLTLFLAVQQPTQREKNKVFAFLILTFSALVFWSLFFIGPMGMTLFIKQYVNSNVMGWVIPPQWFNTINTGIIVIGGPLLAHWFKKKRKAGSDLSSPVLFSIALLFIGIAYAILPMGVYLKGNHELLSIWWVFFSYVLLTLGELFLSPIGVAMIGKLAPSGKQGLLLGIWSMVSGISSMISKYLSQMMVIPNVNEVGHTSINSFSNVFNIIGWVAIFFGVVLFLFVPLVKNLIEGKDPVLDGNKGSIIAQ